MITVSGIKCLNLIVEMLIKFLVEKAKQTFVFKMNLCVLNLIKTLINFNFKIETNLNIQLMKSSQLLIQVPIKNFLKNDCKELLKEI